MKDRKGTEYTRLAQGNEGSCGRKHLEYQMNISNLRLEGSQ